MQILSTSFTFLKHDIANQILLKCIHKLIMSFEIMREFGFVLNGLEIVMDDLELRSNLKLEGNLSQN